MIVMIQLQTKSTKCAKHQELTLSIPNEQERNMHKHI